MRWPAGRSTRARSKVNFPAKRSFYQRILDRVLYQAGLEAELRVDEAEQPFHLDFHHPSVGAGLRSGRVQGRSAPSNGGNRTGHDDSAGSFWFVQPARLGEFRAVASS